MDDFLGLPTSAPATPVAVRGVLDDSPRGVNGGCGSSDAHTPPLPGSVDGALPDFADCLHSPLTFTTASPPRGLGGGGGGGRPLGGGVDVFGLQRPPPPLSTGGSALNGDPYGGGAVAGKGWGGDGKGASPPFLQLPCASSGAMNGGGLPLFPSVPPLTVSPVAGATGGVGGVDGVGGGSGIPDVDGVGGCPPGPTAPTTPALWSAKAWAGATAGPPPPLSGLEAGLAAVGLLPPPANDFDLTAALVGAAAGVGDGQVDGAGDGWAGAASMQVSPMSPFVVANPLPSLDGVSIGGWGGVQGPHPLPVDVAMAAPRAVTKRGGCKRVPVVGPGKGAIEPAAGPAGPGAARTGGGGGVGTGVGGGGRGGGGSSSGPATKIAKKSAGGYSCGSCCRLPAPPHLHRARPVHALPQL